MKMSHNKGRDFVCGIEYSQQLRDSFNFTHGKFVPYSVFLLWAPIQSYRNTSVVQMVQGGKKISNIRPGETKKSNGAKMQKRLKKEKSAKIGNPVKPKRKLNDEEEVDVLLSRAIDKSNEKKMAAKALQSGVRVIAKDLLAGGKELNREARRKQVKNKVSRVEEKLKELESKGEASGLL